MSEEAKTADEQYPSDAPQRGYSLDEKSGVISRTDSASTTPVATLGKDGILSIEPSRINYRAAIVRYLNENDWEITQVILKGDEDIAKQERKIQSNAAAIPPRPKPNRRDGDKTPAFVEWLEKYAPAEYRSRYGIKGPGTVLKTRTVLDADGNPTKEVYEVEVTLARRKTHRTEVEAAGTGMDSQYAD
jgi:hypothetical protein